MIASGGLRAVGSRRGDRAGPPLLS